MAQAEKNPAPDNMRVDLITRFKQNYATVLADAKVSETHTATEGWQHLYQNHRTTQRDRRRSLAKRLHGMADAIEMGTPSEEDDKAIGEFKKESAAIRDAEYSFDAQTISPVKQPVMDCEHCLSDARAQAHRDEADAPMLNIGLEQLMRDEIAKVAKAEWDNETGRVVVHEATA